jgi:hypothetical protein
MSHKRPVIPEARVELDKFKQEVAGDLGIKPSQMENKPYMGNITAQQAGKIGSFQNAGNVGGEMVKRMIQQSEKQMAEKNKQK